MSKLPNYATPHCHPQSLDSASTPEAFAKKEVELGSGALTCTDHGSLAAAYKVYALAKKNNLVPVVGLEGYFRDDNCPILTKLGVLKTPTVPRGSDKDQWKVDHPDGSFFDYNKYYHLTLGFRDYNAYLTAVRLISKADARAELHGAERKPLFDWSDLEELAATNTTLGSGCFAGMVSRHLARSESPASLKLEAAKAYFERLHHLFGDRFYVEVFPHVCSHNFVKGIFLDCLNESTNKVESYKFYFDKTVQVDSVETKAEKLADTWGRTQTKYLTAIKNYSKWTVLDPPLRIVSVRKQDGFIQNECTALSPEGDLQWGMNRFAMGMASRYKVPILVSDDSHFASPESKLVQDVRLAQMGDWKMFSSYHRQGSDESYEYFKVKFNLPETTFEHWIDNSRQFVDGFKDFKFDATIQLPTKFYPQDTLAYTKQLIDKHGRMPNDPKYRARLKQELDLFHRNGKVDLLPYFFTCEEVTSLYSRQGVLTGPARGSAGGALLPYLLGITHIDPLQYDLSLDRFLTKDRIESGKFPDIDSDFPSRDLLCGYECDTIEVEAEDGTKHVLPAGFRIETDQGVMTVEEAVQSQANIKAWW